MTEDKDTPRILSDYYIERKDFFSYLLFFPIVLYYTLFRKGILNRLKRKEALPDYLVVARNYSAIMRDMHAICKSDNKIFYSVLQPLNGAGNRILTKQDNVLLSVQKKEILKTGKSRHDFYLAYYNAVRQELGNEPFFHDFTGVFDSESGQIFFDTIHFSDRGQKIIADALFDIIKKEYDK
jgi:hypothetical protein